MTSENINPQRDPGTPIYDELARSHTTAAPDLPAASAAGATADAPVPAPRAASDLVPPATVLDLFGRMKELEDGDGSWSGGDVVDALNTWFAEYGINVDADAVAAAQALHMPAWLASTLITPRLDASDLVIHVRTDHDRPLESARAYLAALVRGLGEETTAAVFDVAGDQMAHIVHPTVDPAEY